jgi:hypothetical protein
MAERLPTDEELLADAEALEADADAEAVKTADPAEAGRAMTLAEEMFTLKAEIDELEDARKARQARYDEIRKRALPEAMRAGGLLTRDGRGGFTLANGAKVHTRGEIYVAVAAADKPGVIQALKDQGHGDLVKEEVHPGTLKAWVKEQQEAGAPIPAGIKVTAETVAIIVNPKK